MAAFSPTWASWALCIREGNPVRLFEGEYNRARSMPDAKLPRSADEVLGCGVRVESIRPLASKWSPN